MQVSSFSEIEQEFFERVQKAVWCNVATVDTRNRPRSRVLHPIWEGATGWIATGRHTLKTRHLERNPNVSLAYLAEVMKPVYVDAEAEWGDDPAQKRRIWELLRATPPPVGYDPGLFWKSADDPSFGLLKLTPRRIELAVLPGEPRVWRNEQPR